MVVDGQFAPQNWRIDDEGHDVHRKRRTLQDTKELQWGTIWTIWTYYEHIMNMKIQEDKPLWHYGSIWIVPSEHNGGHRKYFLKWFRYAFQYEAKPLNLEVKLASRLPSLCCLCSDCRAAENSAKMVVSIRWHVISTCLEHHKKKQMLKSSKRSSSGLSI